MKRIFLLLVPVLFSCPSVYAQSNTGSSQHLSEYAGQETRAVKSLSEDDIKELLNGEGWGLAKVAELNGIPGPRHILDMGDEIDLNENQRSQIEILYNVMKEDATALGIKYVDLEKQLNESFANRDIDEAKLKDLLMQLAHVSYELRYAHLIAHLRTNEILSVDQVDKYNRLRGYNSADPCENIPEGHDAELWKKHNNC